ncbi:RDD family protein, partial [Bacillus inaquosorum]|nr:RDD family protein [Bacillus inaquosorum]
LIASLILIGVREDKRTLHDLIAGTYVTYASPGEEELDNDEQIRKSE